MVSIERFYIETKEKKENFILRKMKNIKIKN